MIHRPTAVVLIAGALALSGASAAFAYWSVQGSGHSTAQVAQVKSLLVDVDDIHGLILDKTVPIHGVIHNPNDFPASLHGLHITMKTTMDAGHVMCALQNFGIVAPTFTPDSSVPANGDLRLTNGFITLVNSSKDQSMCEGAQLTFDYTLK